MKGNIYYFSYVWWVNADWNWSNCLKRVPRISKRYKKTLWVLCWILLWFNVMTRSLKSCYTISSQSAIIFSLGSTCCDYALTDRLQPMTKLLRPCEVIATKIVPRNKSWWLWIRYVSNSSLFRSWLKLFYRNVDFTDKIIKYEQSAWVTHAIIIFAIPGNLKSAQARVFPRKRL